MKFYDRLEAGLLLAEKLKEYINDDSIVYALPRGGVVTAVEIAKTYAAPLDLIITRKITHPSSPEYAIAATAENGHIIGNRRELMMVDEDWLEYEIGKGQEEAKRRRRIYLHGRKLISPEGKTAILVDDGVATGLSLRVGIMELRHRHPKNIIIAVPVIPRSTAATVRSEADALVALEEPSDNRFLGAVGAYYSNFPQVSDDEVINILDTYGRWLKEEKLLEGVREAGERASIGEDFIEYDEP